MTARRVLTVGGELLREGTSLFDTDTGEVFWYRGLEDGVARLEGLDRSTTVPLDQRYTRIGSGRLAVEPQPPGYAD